MKNRRIFAAILGQSLLIATFAGCSAENGTTTTKPSGTTAETTTESTTETTTPISPSSNQ